MPLVLAEGAIIQCSHGGQCTLAPGNTAVTVSGKGVLTTGAEAPFTFGSAAAPVPGMIVPCTAMTPSGTPQPCATTPALPDGLATKLVVGGKPVLLATAHGATASGTGLGTWQITDPGQTLLEAI
ncbi:hypothetical protein [Streptomyces sp. NPDC048665]|uniref:hypothetical protein n=1 Tax=unclassified Streptomyces TaxID=2593676 RepID=UPI001DBD9B82|nr:hypothetical protein [Streptomyces sp. tea 10]